ncbi:hypothetical protein Tco_0968848 [Tanacetum coccineum]
MVAPPCAEGQDHKLSLIVVPGSAHHLILLPFPEQFPNSTFIASSRSGSIYLLRENSFLSFFIIVVNKFEVGPFPFLTFCGSLRIGKVFSLAGRAGLDLCDWCGVVFFLVSSRFVAVDACTFWESFIDLACLGLSRQGRLSCRGLVEQDRNCPQGIIAGTFADAAVEEEFEPLSCKALVRILQVIISFHEVEFNHSVFHLFSDEMVPYVNVFRARVLDVVAAQSNSTFVITVQRNFIEVKSVVFKLGSHPKDLSATSRHGYVFSIS